MIFVTDRNKIVAALSYLDQRIQEASPNGGTIPYKAYHNIFFFADVVHLNTHGRPILFDNWQIYADGPSGNMLSDFINCYEEYDWDNLSQSDKDGIEAAFDVYLGYGGPHSGLNNIVQQHPAVVKALHRGIGTVVEIEDMLHSQRPKEEREEILQNLYLMKGLKPTDRKVA